MQNNESRRPSSDASGADGVREFAFQRADFERARKLIYRIAGISLAESKQQLVYSRLSRRLRTLGIESFSSYLDALESGRIDEAQEFVNALTTNLTSFFREEHHFPVFAQHVARAGARRPQRVWCTAASTGEEPYTIAMSAIEGFGTMTPPVEIIATDIDTNVLATARNGAYRLDAVSRLGKDRLHRFFMRGKGANDGWVKVRPEVQALVRFAPLNLLADRYPFNAPFDVIFCRNVMIYFDKPTQLSILERFVPLLQGDGLLFCGHSENFAHARHLFRLRGQTIYEPANRASLAA